MTEPCALPAPAAAVGLGRAEVAMTEPCALPAPAAAVGLGRAEVAV